ncbi:hypothetical protein ACFQZ4_18175 [Catellatospora coxensis]
MTKEPASDSSGRTAWTADHPGLPTGAVDEAVRLLREAQETRTPCARCASGCCRSGTWPRRTPCSVR